ncbi:MAG: Mut7-C RNAse domain-containing protein, partial [Planctomycetota bacterium]
GELGLPVRPESRCMACGGSLEEVDKAGVRDEAPTKAYAAHERFWRCDRCGKLLWRGTHWRKIVAVLDQIRRH